MPIFFKFNYLLFGLNPQGFHLTSFLIFLLLIVAVYHLFSLLTLNRRLAIIGAFLYATWPVHFVSLSWLSTTSYIIGPLFQVLSLIFLLRLLKYKKISNFWVSLIFFALAMASSELTLVLPLIMFVYLAINGKMKFFKYLLPFLLIDIFYLILRFLMFPIPAKGDYALSINFQIVNNLFWYIFWALGFPESFKSLIFPSQLAQSIKVITQFWQISLGVSLLFLVLLKLFLKTLNGNIKFYSWCCVFLVLGLAPVLPLVNHSYPIYLGFAGIGLILIILQSIKKAPHLYLFALLVLWIWVAFYNFRFTRATHWVRNEQAISKAYVDFTKKTVTNPQGGAVFLFRPGDLDFNVRHKFSLKDISTVRQTLNYNDAMQVIYNDSSLKSFYANFLERVDLPKQSQFYEISPTLKY